MDQEQGSPPNEPDSEGGKILEFVVKDREEDKQLPNFVRAFGKLQKENRLLLPASITDESTSLGNCLQALRFLLRENRIRTGDRAGLPKEFLLFLEHGMIDPQKITEEEWGKIAGIEPGINNVIQPDFNEHT